MERKPAPRGDAGHTRGPGEGEVGPATPGSPAWDEQGRFKDIVNLLPFPIAVIDISGRIEFANPRFVSVFGYTLEDVPDGRSWFTKAYPDPGYRRNVVQAWWEDLAASREGEVGPRTFDVTCKDGAVKTIVFRLIAMERCKLFYVFEDITERTRMEQDLLRAQKLESLGVLAGGLAHDFNNILTGIMANLSVVKGFGELPEDLETVLQEAERASMRAKGLTHQLLTFARGGEPVRQTASLPKLIRETTEFSLSGSNVRCELDLPDNLWLADLDRSQFSQVIQNLVLNALQAMPEGGTLRIGAENRVFGQGAVPLLAPGRYVRISLEDEGAGIAEENLDRVFDPYFTTRQKGVGLGLATAFSVVQKHGGRIEVASRVGVGTTFTLYVPASEKKRPEEEAPGPSPARRAERILLIDDEQSIRRAAREILQRLGYEVEAAPEGRAGLDLYRRARDSGRPFDAVIVDLTVPGGMGGRETIRELLRLDPEARGIVSSGYSNDPVMSSYAEYGFRGVVAKPYSMADLATVLERVLADR